MSNRISLLIGILSLLLFLASILGFAISANQGVGSELHSSGSYPYRFQLEKSFEFNHQKPIQDYYFALIPADSTLDTLQVRVYNGAPNRSFVEFTEFYSGKHVAENSNSDPESALNPPLLVNDSHDYPDIIIPILRGRKQAEVWYLDNSSRPTTSKEFAEADSMGVLIKSRQFLLEESYLKRMVETSGVIDSLIVQEIALLAASDFDPRADGTELLLQVTMVHRDDQQHRSQIRCYHLRSWSELWRFEVPCGVLMHMGLKDEAEKLESHLFVLRGDYQGNAVNGIEDTTSYAIKLDLNGELLADPLPLGPTPAAWHVESSYPLPGCDNRFLMYGYNPDADYSYLEILDTETLEVLNHKPVPFVEGCHVIPTESDAHSTFQVVLFRNQVSFMQYNNQLELQRELELSEPSKMLFWLDGMRGDGFSRSGTHLLLGGLRSGLLVLLGPEFEILSADKIQEEPLGTRCTVLQYSSAVNPLEIRETEYNTWYLNFNNSAAKGHFTRRPIWFLSYIKERYPVPSLLLLAAILVYLFGYLYLFRQRWQFYSMTVNNLFRHFTDGILICDSADKVLSTNHVLHELMASEKPEILPVGKRKWSFAFWKRPELPTLAELLRSSQLESLYKEVFMSGSTAGTVELLKDNQPVTYSYRLEYMISRGAKENRMLILHDVTQQLEETKRTIWKFMSQNTAHRLKSPLQRIKTVAESTIIKRQRGKLELEDVDENLQKILATTRDVNQMIHDFLMVSDRKIRPRELDLSKFLMKNIQYYRQKNLSEGVQLKITLADELPFVMADEYHLLTLLVNLLDNGLKAVQGEGTITVSAEPVTDTDDPHERWLRLKIEDDGIGIPSDLLPRIFQHHSSFFKDGHGVGLAVVYSIVQAHQGRISVDSTPGKGTLFQVDLPLVEQSLQ